MSDERKNQGALGVGTSFPMRPFEELLRDQVTATVKILKTRFGNLAAEEVNDLAWKIVIAVRTA